LAVLARPLRAERFGNFAVPVIALGVTIGILYWARSLFITLLIAVIIAFILEPLVTALMRVRFPRSVASFVVCSLALLCVYLMGLGAYSQVSGLTEDLPKYSQRISELVDGLRRRVEATEQSMRQLVIPARQREQERQAQQQQQQLAEQARQRRRKTAPPPAATVPAIQEVRIHDDRTPIMDYVSSNLGSVYQILLMTSFVPFLVYFMLSWRDHIYRSFLQFFEGEDRLVAAKSLQGVAEMVRAFVVGNFMLGVLLAMESSFFFWLIRLPYPLLIGPLSGFLSLIPYIGLPLALIPPMFTALAVFKTLSGYLLVFAIVTGLHLLALNLMYPKIVGSRVHLNPLVVTLALMLWGFLWDAAGLVLAIPLTAAIKAVCDNVKALRPYGKFLGD
jgi:predicted PurR-regulated permease PerM